MAANDLPALSPRMAMRLRCLVLLETFSTRRMPRFELDPLKRAVVETVAALQGGRAVA